MKHIGELSGEEHEGEQAQLSVSFVCPKCGDDAINELTVCIVSHPVRSWSDDGEPVRYGPPIVDWQSSYPYSIVGGGGSKTTFECANCMEQFEHPARIV
jgi:predicted RNA-binding Zn-ribbon protein involved in translation (DUF1610 family)